MLGFGICGAGDGGWGMGDGGWWIRVQTRCGIGDWGLRCKRALVHFLTQGHVRGFAAEHDFEESIPKHYKS
jgi:hypothetical protein